MLILNGKKIADQKALFLKKQFALLPFRPVLVIVWVGDNFASKKYISFKFKKAHELGVSTRLVHLPATSSFETIAQTLLTLNQDPTVTGYLVQMPLPPHILLPKVLTLIDPQKDVDGLSIRNAGNLYLGFSNTVAPATPRGIVELLKAYKIFLSGKVVAVVGRSNIVGKPVAQLLLKENATVITCHSKSDLNILKIADVVVVAAGSPKLVNRTLLKPGAVVVDVGITRGTDNKIVGDVDFGSVKNYVSGITPLPGGVGPMTIISLFQNLYDLIKNKSLSNKNT